MSEKIRVRFAPAPTGMMHLGNIRTALFNHLIATKKNGTMVLRIEDTDATRNFDPQAKHIQKDLQWLGIDYQEGPVVGGSYAPYFQSERTELYQQELQKLIADNKVYRCFCTQEELEKKKNRQIALKKPPRYDRTCINLKAEESKTKAETLPFVWRFKLDHTKTITINDLAHKQVTFELKNFSDFPVTRQDGSVTFMFANFVDDVAMKISCIIRGEDHLSNTAGQAALYDACNIAFPTFWHMPILCNIDGKKLSKRDFGFSLNDLKQEGFLPEAIINYLAIIGGSFKNEIMNQQELVNTLNFGTPSTTGQIKYDVEKLRWVNEKWINQLDIAQLTKLTRPYLETGFDQAKTMSDTELQKLIGFVQKEMATLQESVPLLTFYFKTPEYDSKTVAELLPNEVKKSCLIAVEKSMQCNNSEELLPYFKIIIKNEGIKTKTLFTFLRYALTGKTHGLSIGEIFTILPLSEIKLRFKKMLNKASSN